MLDRIAHDPDFHCDELMKVTAPAWSTGRMVMLGDSAWSGSPLTGRGTAMAIMGAEALADAVIAHPGDLDIALHAYEARMRRFARWGHADASSSMLKRWAPSTSAQARMNAVVMRAVIGTPLRRGVHPRRHYTPVVRQSRAMPLFVRPSCFTSLLCG